VRGDRAARRGGAAQPAVTSFYAPVGCPSGPTLLAEKLAETHELVLSRETLRQWLMEAGLWRSRRQREKAQGVTIIGTKTSAKHLRCVAERRRWRCQSWNEMTCRAAGAP
jgi:hypothetical protein